MEDDPPLHPTTPTTVTTPTRTPPNNPPHNPPQNSSEAPRRVTFQHSDYLDDADSSHNDDTTTSSDTTPIILSSQNPIEKLHILKNITIEPLMLLHMIGMAGSSVVVQNLYIDRICTVTLNHTQEICSDLSSHPDVETPVESTAALYTTYRGLIEAGFPIIFSLFLGPWTDAHGTKYPILLPLLGYLLSALTYLLITFIPSCPPAFILFASIPVALSGGMVALIMSVFSFMSKITSVENRSFRVAMLEASWFLGGPIGLVMGGYIYKYGSFQDVFITCAILYAVGFVYGVVVIREDVQEVGGNRCHDMFNVTAVKDIFATIGVRREGQKRAWMHLMLLTICLRIFAMMGYLNTLYLYTRHKFGWDLKNYTEYSVADSFITITGSYVMIMITMRIFKLNDAVIGVIGSVGSIFGSVVFAVASQGWMIYAGSILSMFAGLISIVIRSMLSKIVAKEEIAKVFTFLACGEASMPLIAVPLYNVVFVETLETFPGTVFFISAGVYIVILGAFGYLYWNMRGVSFFEELADDERGRSRSSSATEGDEGNVVNA